MSLKPCPLPAVPDETARVARASFRKGNIYVRIRDELGVFFEDETFAPLFAERGQPAETPWRLALVSVMQFMEGLTDRQTADAVRGRMDWKYALSLELDDPGFDFSVLSEFRDRLLAGGMEGRLLDIMLSTFKARGWLKARGRQRTDSTHVLAAIRVLNRLELVGETLRAALNALATVIPDWLRAQSPVEWYERYGRRVEDYRLPQSDAARDAYARVIGADGFQLMGLIYGEDAPEWVRWVPAIEVLRLIWLQQYVVMEGQIQLRALEDLPPARQRISSPYDEEAHYASKRATTWTGYKVHLTESCDEAGVHLITHVQTTVAPATDMEMTTPIQAALVDKGLAPAEHLIDAGYVDAHVLVTSQTEQAITIVGPVQLDRHWQARVEGAYDITAFTIDWASQRITCPQGRTSTAWHPHQDRHGNHLITVKFARQTCLECPGRILCTQADVVGRRLTLHPEEEHKALQAARQKQQGAEWKAKYDARAGIEGTLSQGIRAFELRRSRYIGLAKTHLQHILTAAAINVGRVYDHLGEYSPAQAKPSRFRALAPAV
jgi:transposase